MKQWLIEHFFTGSNLMFGMQLICVLVLFIAIVIIAIQRLKEKEQEE